MTTPPSPDNDPDTPEPAWAPPGASPPAEPPPAPPATPPESQPAPSPARTNRLAIAALVTGLIGLVVFAVAFAIAALVQTGRRRERGRGLAFGGLAASAAWAAAAAVLVTSGATPFTSNDEGSDWIRLDGFVRISSLKVGDCFTARIHAPADPFVDPSPCDHPHNGEVTAKATLAAGPFPGNTMLSELARSACRERVRGKVRQADDDDFEPRPGLPDKETWADGEHEVTCTLVYNGEGSLTTNLARHMIVPAAGPTLKRGDCIEEWINYTWAQPVIECTEKHELQVLTVYEVDDREYPGLGRMKKRAIDDCAEYAAKIWGAAPPSHLVDPGFVVPTEKDWRRGIRQVVCLVESRHGPLKRSVVPH